MWVQCQVHGLAHSKHQYVVAHMLVLLKKGKPFWQVTGWSIGGRKLGEISPTSITEVINQHNLGDQLWG